METSDLNSFYKNIIKLKEIVHNLENKVNDNKNVQENFRDLINRLNSEYKFLLSNNKLNNNIKDYILSQYKEIGEQTNNYEEIKEICQKFIERYNNFYSKSVMNMDISKNNYDVLLSDINHRILVDDISKRLGIDYLSNYDTINKQINGIVYGSNYRLMCGLPIKIKNISKFIIFLIDTGSPWTYICEDVFNNYKFNNIPDTCNCLMNNINFNVKLSPLNGHFNDVNLIGGDFLKFINCELIINYKNDTFILLSELF